MLGENTAHFVDGVWIVGKILVSAVHEPFAASAKITGAGDRYHTIGRLEAKRPAFVANNRVEAYVVADWQIGDGVQHWALGFQQINTGRNALRQFGGKHVGVAGD